LVEGDKILAESVIGPVITVDDLIVKAVTTADQSKYAITLHRLGTIFVHADTIVRVLPADRVVSAGGRNG
jgi:hypothetical protein